MWTDGIVIHSPRFDDAASFAKPVEQMLVEARVPQATIKRFHERILRRLSGRDVVPFDPGLLHPFQDRVTGQLCAVVRDDHLRTAEVLGSSGPGMALKSSGHFHPATMAQV